MVEEQKNQEGELKEDKSSSPPFPDAREGKLEFLKREEIRTMERDLSRLREAESEKERGRIANIEKPEKPASAVSGREEKPVPLMPKIPQAKKFSPWQKILVRVLIILIVLLIIGFLYWFIAVRGKEAPPSEKRIPIKEVPVEKAAPIAEEIKEPKIQIPEINERVVNWGHYIPVATRTIDTIIIHSAYNAIGGDVHDMEQVIEEFRMYRVTSHYLITRDGIIYQLAPNEAVAYHTGYGKMPDGGRENAINLFSIGIEMIYTKTESPTEAQYQSLVQLVKYLQQGYDIPLENILGHKDVSPGRKTDPWNFDREHLESLIR